MVNWPAVRRRANNLKAGELRKLAEQTGWTYRNAVGSHHYYVKAGQARPLAILDKPKAKGTIRSIINRLEEADAEPGRPAREGNTDDN